MPLPRRTTAPSCPGFTPHWGRGILSTNVHRHLHTHTTSFLPAQQSYNSPALTWHGNIIGHSYPSREYRTCKLARLCPSVPCCCAVPQQSHTSMARHVHPATWDAHPPAKKTRAAGAVPTVHSWPDRGTDKTHSTCAGGPHVPWHPPHPTRNTIPVPSNQQRTWPRCVQKKTQPTQIAFVACTHLEQDNNMYTTYVESNRYTPRQARQHKSVWQ